MTLSTCSICREPVDVKPGGPTEHAECRNEALKESLFHKAYELGRREAFEEAIAIVEKRYNASCPGAVEFHWAECLLEEIRAHAAEEKE